MKKFALAILSLHCLLGVAQIGGNHTYEFLNIPVSARVAALGGNALAVYDDDSNLGLDNPSLLNATMHSTLSLTYIDYLADVNYGFVSYTKQFKKLGTFSGGLKYVNYGTFLETDEGGNELGNFTAGEYALVLGWGYSLDSSFSVGANLKPVYSSLYTYNSFGVALDVAATYNNKAKLFTTSLVIKNIGRQIKPFTEGNIEPLPFEIQWGLSKQLEHVPIRLLLNLTNLQKWDLTYNDSITNPTQSFDITNPDDNNKKPSFFDKALRHVVVGAEIMPSKSFNVRFGFNYKRRKELALTNKPGMVGFSWGLGFRIKKFHLSYGSAKYHLAGSTNNITVSTKFSEWFTNKTSAESKPKKDKKHNKSIKNS
jgi:hypothetical protein